MKKLTGVTELDDIFHRLSTTSDRDDYEDIRRELAVIAPRYVQELTELYDSGIHYNFNVVGCLIGQKSPEVMALFEKAIKDKDQFVRWAAAIGISKFRTRAASQLLVAALKDRAHFVKSEAVQAMSRFRDPDAVPQLKKIIASKHLQQSAPGIVTEARRALERCNKVLEERQRRKKR